MKRSEYIALGAVGLLAIATFWPRGGQEAPRPNADSALTAGDGFQTLAFESVDECRQSQAVTQAVCDTEFGKAQERSIADAPKFNALSDCEAEYGASACRPATWNGASVFVPALAGVLIARSLTNAAQARSQPLYPPLAGVNNCPTGVDTTLKPECAPRSSSSSSGSSAARSSSRVHYSTGTGRVIGRVVGAVVVDALYPSRSSFPRASSTVLRTGGSGGISTTSRSTSWGSSVSRPSTSPAASSTPTASRGGFGSTGRSISSSS